MALSKITADSIAANAVNANSIGYTPANKAGDTFTGNVAITSASSGGLLVNAADQASLRLQPAYGMSNTTYRAARIDFYQNQGVQSAPMWTLINDYDQVNTNTLELVNGDSYTRVLKVDQVGRIRLPYQPSFCQAWGASAYYSTSSGSTIKWGLTGGSGSVSTQQKQHNVGGYYSTSTGRFTAPIAGVYNFSMASYHSTNIADSYVMLYVNGSNIMYTAGSQWGSGYNGINFSVNLSLNASDYVEVVAGQNLSMYGTSRFSGHLLG